MQYRDQELPIPYIEIEFGQYAFDMLFDAGPVMINGMGEEQPLDHPYLQAYASLYGLSENDWEPRLILQMSKAYKSGLNEGASLFSIAPVDR